MKRQLTRLAAAVLLGVVCSATAEATVYLNALPTQFVQTTGSTTMLSRYRLNQTNWDQMIANGSNITYGTIIQTNNIGNVAALNALTWDFTLGHTAGLGFNFTLSRLNGPSWVVSYMAPGGNPVLSPTRSFNMIEIYLKARSSATYSTWGNVTNLMFSGLPTSGSLTNMVGVAPPNGDFNQYLFSTTDLSLTNWSLTGQVQLGYSGTTFSDEMIVMDLKTKSGTSDVLTSVPEPASLLLLGSFLGGAAGLTTLRRRRR